MSKFCSGKDCSLECMRSKKEGCLYNKFNFFQHTCFNYDLGLPALNSCKDCQFDSLCNEYPKLDGYNFSYDFPKEFCNSDEMREIVNELANTCRENKTNNKECDECRYSNFCNRHFLEYKPRDWKEE